MIILLLLLLTVVCKLLLLLLDVVDAAEELVTVLTILVDIHHPGLSGHEIVGQDGVHQGGGGPDDGGDVGDAGVVVEYPGAGEHLNTWHQTQLTKHVLGQEETRDWRHVGRVELEQTTLIHLLETQGYQ